MFSPKVFSNFANVTGLQPEGFRSMGSLSYPGFRVQGGLGADTSYGGYSTSELIRQATVGYNNLPFNVAQAQVAAIKDAVSSEGLALPPAAAENVAKWDMYIAKLGPKIAMTPEQYKASGGRAGTMAPSITSEGGIFSSILSAVGLGPKPTPTGAGASGTGGKKADDKTMWSYVLLGGLGIGALYFYSKNKRHQNPVTKCLNPIKKLIRRVVR